MRKILFVSALLTLGVTRAQTDQTDRLIIEKGTWNLTGSASLSFGSNDSENASFSGSGDFNSFSLNPLFGYAVNDNFVVGLGLGYGRTSSESDSVDNDGLMNEFESEGTGYSIFPYARKFFSISSNFAFFLQGEARYTNGSNEVTRTLDGATTFTSDADSESWFFGFRPGITYFVSKRFAFEANLGALGYATSNNEGNTGTDVSESDSREFNFELNPANLFFGLSYYF